MVSAACLRPPLVCSRHQLPATCVPRAVPRPDGHSHLPHQRGPQRPGSPNGYVFLSFLLPSLTDVPVHTVELQVLAHEVQEVLQAKIGTTSYSAVHTQIRQKVAERRNERKTAIALQVRPLPPSLSIQTDEMWFAGDQRSRGRREEEGAEERAEGQVEEEEGSSYGRWETEVWDWTQ